MYKQKMKTILESIRKIFDAVAKRIASILVVFWLWIPSLYALLVAIGLIVARVEFQPISTVFWIGFFICLATSVIVLVLKGPRPFGPKPQTATDPNQKPLGVMPQATQNTSNQYVVVQSQQPQPQNTTQQHIQTPLVFASRVDPSLFVHEYNDRLMFYKKEGKQILYLGTEFKQPC